MDILNKAEMGRRIKLIRKKAGLRQWQLASTLGTTQSAVHKYEHGVIPEPRRLIKLAQLGNTTIEWILTGEHWENGSVDQERLPVETYTLAERLLALGPERRKTLDEALRIITDAVDAMSDNDANGKLADLTELAVQLSLVPAKQKGIFSAALRIHRSILDSVLDLEMERLRGTELPPSTPGKDSEPKSR